MFRLHEGGGSRYGRLRTLALLSLLVTSASVATAGEPTRVKVSGRVIGASGAHPLSVLLWGQDHFLEKPAQSVKIPARGAPEFAFSVPVGEWAVSAYEDLNENGVLDMGMFGPREPSGFWREFTAWRRPTFKDVSVVVAGDVTDAQVRLK